MFTFRGTGGQLAGVLLAAIAVRCGPPASVADLVLIHGRVVTLDDTVPEAQAVAVANGRIAAVGTDEEIEPWIGASTEVIDLEGRLTVPGLIEAHGHLKKIGRLRANLDLSTTRDWSEVVEKVRRAADGAEPSQWIFGRGWHQEKWSSVPQPNVRGFPVHDELSRVAPDNPVHLRHASGHASIDNLRAMERAGIDAGTPDPPGGEILRRPDGSPSGIFLENAENPLLEAYETDRDSASETRRLFEEGARECLSKGITSFHDAGVPFDDLDVLKRMVDDGTLDLRVYAMIDSEDPEFFDRAAAYRVTGYGDDRLTVRAVKVYVDGALGSRGAWLLSPYEDDPRSKGQVVHTVEEIEAVARYCRDNDLQLCVHAIGDRGNREMLDLYDRVSAGEENMRWRIEHAQHLHPDDVPRFAELGVVAAMQPVHCTSDGPWVLRRIGERRAREGAYVWRALLDSGAVIASGTDAPVEDVDPVANFYAAVTRRLPDGSEFFPEQCMTRAEALRSMTLDAAWAAFEEELKGSIAVGKLADLTVLSRDILSVPEDDIPGARAVYTIIGGKVVFRAPDARVPD